MGPVIYLAVIIVIWWLVLLLSPAGGAGDSAGDSDGWSGDD